MDFPRLTPEQIMFNENEFEFLIYELRESKPQLADRFMMNRSKLEHHMKAQESELEVMDAYKAHEEYLLERLKKSDRREQHVR